MLLGTGTAPLAIGALIVGRVLTLFGPLRRDDIAAVLCKAAQELFAVFDNELCVALACRGEMEHVQEVCNAEVEMGGGIARQQRIGDGPGNIAGVSPIQGAPTSLELGKIVL